MRVKFYGQKKVFESGHDQIQKSFMSVTTIFLFLVFRPQEHTNPNILMAAWQ